MTVFHCNEKMKEKKDERGFKTCTCIVCGIIIEDSYKYSEYEHEFCLKCSFLKKKCVFKNKFKRIEIEVVYRNDGNFPPMSEKCGHYPEYRKLQDKLNSFRSEMMENRCKLRNIMKGVK